MKLTTYRVFALPFFIAAALIYIHVTFLSQTPVACDVSPQMFSAFNLDCLLRSATVAVVIAVAMPGVLLWAVAKRD